MAVVIVLEAGRRAVNYVQEIGCLPRMRRRVWIILYVLRRLSLEHANSEVQSVLVNLVDIVVYRRYRVSRNL